MAGSSIGWLVLVGGAVVMVEAVRHLASARAAAAGAAGTGGAGSSGSVGSASASGGMPGGSSGGSGGQPLGGVQGNAQNVGGGSLPTTVQLGSWWDEAAQWANGQAGNIAPGGSPQGLANAIRAIVIGESNGYPDALGDNGQSHGLIQLNQQAFGATASDPAIYRSLTNSLNVPGVGDRILRTYNAFVSRGIDPLGNSANFGAFWAQAQGAVLSGTTALAGGVLEALRGLVGGPAPNTQPLPPAPTNSPAPGGGLGGEPLASWPASWPAAAPMSQGAWCQAAAAVLAGNRPADLDVGAWSTTNPLIQPQGTQLATVVQHWCGQ